MSRRLLIITPGLLGPLADRGGAEAILPSLPGLSSLLAHADVRRAGREQGDLAAEAALFTAFGVDDPPWPVAAVSRAGEADVPEVGSRWWLRVDPVHLRVDMTHARLFGGRMLDLDAGEAIGLVARLNEHFGADGMRLEAPAADRWYLALSEASDLSTWSPAEVAGRNVNHFLPRGAQGAIWRRRMNEAQMLLHDAPENHAREAAGRPVVNSIWPWGGGRAPCPRAGPGPVLADDAVAIGMARLAGVPQGPLPLSPADIDIRPGSTVLAVDLCARDPLIHGEASEWLAALQALEDRWFAPLVGQLARRRLDELQILAGGGRRFRVTSAGLRWRFWRRSTAWTRWLEAAS